MEMDLNLGVGGDTARGRVLTCTTSAGKGVISPLPEGKQPCSSTTRGWGISSRVALSTVDILSQMGSGRKGVVLGDVGYLTASLSSTR